jgi:hypothetical protein
VKRVLVLALVLACDEKRTEGASLDEAQAQVRKFFTAATGDDCATVQSLIPDMKDCASYLHTWHEDGISLVEVQGASRDGRDPRAVIVRVRMQTKGRQRDLLVRAIHDGARWSLLF